MNIEELSDFDNFYYYGLGDINTEIKSDVYQVVMQNSRSLFYNRDNDSAKIDNFENTPNAITQSILIPYSIVSALSKRNTYVGNGQNSTKDRRIVLSQNSIKVNSSGNNLGISIFYISLVDINQIQKTTINIPVI